MRKKIKFSSARIEFGAIIEYLMIIKKLEALMNKTKKYALKMPFYPDVTIFRSKRVYIIHKLKTRLFECLYIKKKCN